MESPLPGSLLDRSIAEGELDLGHATLLLSGGTNELARSEHQTPAAIRAAAKQRLAALSQVLGAQDEGRIESAASRKMTALTHLLMALCPLAKTIVLPRANHLALTTRDFLERAAELLADRSYTFPLYSYLKVHDDEHATTLASVGMWTFGLPDVAMAVDGIDSTGAAAALGAIQREMVAEGWWPEQGAIFDTPSGRVSLHPTWQALWVTPEGVPPNPPARAARARFERREQIRQMLPERTLHHRPAAGGRLAIEHLLSQRAAGMAITNGLSDSPQPGGTIAEENAHVELAIASTDLGPWANGWLDWASQSIRNHDPSRPVRPFDRLVLDEPFRGIAGAIVWPMGHLTPLREGDPTVQLWELIPILIEELAHFRASPGTQGQWIEQRHERGDIPAIQSRWTKPPTVRASHVE